jgi:hypothetical protein
VDWSISAIAAEAIAAKAAADNAAISRERMVCLVKPNLTFRVTRETRKRAQRRNPRIKEARMRTASAKETAGQVCLRHQRRAQNPDRIRDK